MAAAGGAGELLELTRLDMKGVESLTKLDTLRDGPEIQARRRFLGRGGSVKRGQNVVFAAPVTPACRNGVQQQQRHFCSETLVAGKNPVV